MCHLKHLNAQEYNVRFPQPCWSIYLILINKTHAYSKLTFFISYDHHILSSSPLILTKWGNSIGEWISFMFQQTSSLKSIGGQAWSIRIHKGATGSTSFRIRIYDQSWAIHIFGPNELCLHSKLHHIWLCKYDQSNSETMHGSIVAIDQSFSGTSRPRMCIEWHGYCAVILARCQWGFLYRMGAANRVSHRIHQEQYFRAVCYRSSWGLEQK